MNKIGIAKILEWHNSGTLSTDEAVERICSLFSVSNPKGTVCLEHDWKGDSFDHFGFCLEEVCENCGEKRQTGC